VEGHRDIKIMRGPGTRPRYDKYATTVWLASGSDNPGSNKFLQPFGWAEFSPLTDDQARQYRSNRKQDFAGWEAEQQEILVRYREQAAALAREQEQRELEAARLAEERQRREEELRRYPWRALLPELERVADWGALKTRVLENEDFVQFQGEKEIGEAVGRAAVRVAEANRKKWDEERDRMVADWLQPSSVDWQPMAASAAKPAPETRVDTDLLRAIEELQDWDAWKKLKVTISKLDPECSRALMDKFKGWKLKKSKNKQQKKAYNDLAKRVKKFG
jgi:hypothetical protein